MVRTQYLTQENPQRDERRIDPIQPAHIDRCQRLRDDPLSEHIGERKASILKKLPPQEPRLVPKQSLVRISHPWAALPVMGVLPNTIYASEACLPISLPAKDLLGNYVRFVNVTDAPSAVAHEMTALSA
jgi:hypothetical protein